MHSQATQAEKRSIYITKKKNKTKQNKKQDNEHHNDSITLSRENFSWI